MGRNEKMSESAEVWLDPANMHPVRSTRKLVSGGRTLYVDCAYTPAKIVVRHKYAGQQVTQLDIPLQQAFYDFEELMWLPPQIQWTDEQQNTYVNFFNTFRFQQETTVVYRDGMDKLDIAGKIFPATRYRFSVGATQYVYWSVDQDGREVPAKVFMDDADNRRDVTFIDLLLSLKKCKASAAAWAAKPLPPPVAAGISQAPPGQLPPPAQIPPSYTPDQPYPGQPEPAPAAPGDGGPPPPSDGNRFPPPPDQGGF
jgi:hypothetical protein